MTGAASRPRVAGLDIGGTKALAVVTDDGGEVLATARVPTADGPEGLLGTVTEALVDVTRAAKLGVDGLAAVGVGIPGLVDPANGTLRHAVNLGIADGPLDLAGPVNHLVGAPVVVANDTNVAALGAAELFGGVADLAFLSLGTGVSVGFVVSGEIHAGFHGVAGEIGHLPLNPNGVICECGQRGCLETVASGRAIARRWPADDPNALGPAASLLAAAGAGDAKAIAVRDEVSAAVASAVALVAQTFDPEIVVLGGGVAEAGEPLLEAVRDALRARANGSPLLAAFDLGERLRIVPPGMPVGALGAARAARNLLAV